MTGSFASRLTAVLVSFAFVFSASAAVTPEMQRQARASTFEVVMKKPTGDAVTYEKPLPLELLPYIERTDLYQSIGTAFALGKNSYVTAAHVLLAAVDSQYGPPALRGSDSKVHLITNVLKFSAHEDFVVFSIADDGDPPGLPTNRTPKVDDPVLAVGNALGEGIVMRDGLFTSETPEEQDGRWKWIRFSAAASPGNSGGPLLDATGNVIGVVIAKSVNENLNYALPIANVLDDRQSQARFDQRSVVRLGFLDGSKTYALKDQFALPLPWPQFVRAYQSVMHRHDDKALGELLAGYASTMFPAGDGSEDILYGNASLVSEIGVVSQKAGGQWHVEEGGFQDTDLPGDGKLRVGRAELGAMVSVSRGMEASDDAFVADSKAFMDIVLKGLNVRRRVGTDEVRVVSVGAAQSDVAATDSYGRKWQVRVWALPYTDAFLVGQLLPTPDGYAAIIQYAPSASLAAVKSRLSLLANQVTVTYRGTLGQWRAFLARRAWLPTALQNVTLDSAPAWKFHTPRFEMAIPKSVMPLDARSRLVLAMGFDTQGGKAIWDIRGAWWYRDAQEKAYIGLSRHARPAATSKLELRNAFEDVRQRHSPYDGTVNHVSADTLEESTAIEVPGSKEGMASSDAVYALTLHLDGHPAQDAVSLLQIATAQATHILERNVGPDVAVAGSSEIQFSGPFRAMQELAKTYDEQFGKDIRGKTFSQDLQEFGTASVRKLAGSAAASEASGVDPNQLQEALQRDGLALMNYWRIAGTVVRNRDLWGQFLAHNHLPLDSAHEPAVLEADTRLRNLLNTGSPSPEWFEVAQQTQRAYVTERGRIARSVHLTTPAVYHPRQSACPEPANGTSGNDKPRPTRGARSLEEFYPAEVKRQGVEGVVVLSVRVDSAGCAKEATVQGSSGSDELDAAALRWVDTANFMPAEKDGKPVAGETPVAVAFELRE